MVAQSAALQQCFNEVVDSAPMALERCLNHVVSVLQEAEYRSEHGAKRIELGAAWRELLAHQAAWCKRFPDELRTALATAAARQTGSPHPRAAATERTYGAELALVDDAAIVEEIASSRLVHYVMPVVEQPVSELDALVSSAMGLESVRPELNPVRPEIFAQSLRALMGGSLVTATTGSLWMQYMAEPLGEELQNLYGRLVTQLRDANIQAADYRRAPTSAPAARRPDPVAGADPAPAAAQPHREPDWPAGRPSYPNLSSQQIGGALLRDFLFNGGGERAAQALPASYYADVERELALLHSRPAGERDGGASTRLPAGYREMAPVDRPQRPVGVQSKLDSRVWGEHADSHERSVVRTKLRRDARRVGQVLGLELVRKVVDQVAQDSRLLAPVREAIVALEPSLLRLAMVDPRFFSDAGHPGRLLMEQVAQRSFRYNDEFGADFAAFFDDVSRSFNALNRTVIVNAAPFEQALAQLKVIWDDADRREVEHHRQAVAAMRFAELRQAEADRMAWELSSRPDLDNVPSVVQDFLFGRWTLVMAHARLTDKDNQIDPQGYRGVITDLLWSVKREVTLKQPAQLFERVPRLVAALRAGLASIGQESSDNEAFFQALMKLHHPVLKLRRAKSRRDARESGMTPLTAADPVPMPAGDAMLATAGGDPTAIDQPWMNPGELNAAGFEDTLPTDMAALAAESGAPDPARAAAVATSAPAGKAEQKAPRLAQPPPDVESVMATLREGEWFDLYSKRRWLRAQLIWASSKATLFMFVSHGGQPHSMTRRICERLIRDRYLRPVRVHGVVARALDMLDQDTAPAAAPRPLGSSS